MQTILAAGYVAVILPMAAAAFWIAYGLESRPTSLNCTLIIGWVVVFAAAKEALDPRQAGNQEHDDANATGADR